MEREENWGKVERERGKSGKRKWKEKRNGEKWKEKVGSFFAKNGNGPKLVGRTNWESEPVLVGRREYIKTVQDVYYLPFVPFPILPFLAAS